jgi:2-C-methyl-D-erythritol 4-phosphate cytidylyltransferase
MKNTNFSVVFLAGGIGTRMRSEIPKQYLPIHAKPLALYSFEVFATMPEVQEIVVVCEPQYGPLFQSICLTKRINLQIASPGDRRQDSVFNGLQLLKDDCLVCIHDSARPLIEESIIRQVVQTAESWDAAVVGVKVKSTIKVCDDAQVVIDTPNRANLWEIQTPQVVRLSLLKEGFAYAEKHHLTVTDDVSLVELLGKPVKVVEGSHANIKVTTREDLVFVERFLEQYALL